MMDHLTTDDLDRLITGGDGPRVSLYIPTERRGAETQQNPIRFKNVISGALETLEERGVRHAEAESLLAPAVELLENDDFWQHQEDGLAVFIDGDGLQRWRLPIEVETLATVGDRFHVKPLLPVVEAGAEFYVLALSHNQVRLLRGTHYGVSQLDLKDIPTSIDEALWYRDPEEQLQLHATSAGTRRAAFHGHGLDGQSSEEDIQTFFRAVDRGVAAIIDDVRAPVVLAGVEYLLPLYRDISELQVVEEGIQGNPDRTSMEELHVQAWPLVAGIFDARRVEAADRFLAAASATTDSVPETVEAAANGQVASLFIPDNGHRWGTFHPDTLAVEVGEGPSDLYDVAAAATWRNGGDVFVVDEDDMPGEGEIAAVLRYSVD